MTKHISEIVGSEHRLGRRHFVFLCSCGNRFLVRTDRVATRKFRECVNVERIQHGLSQTSTYRIWVGMKVRCSNSKERSYKNYGGRGIKVCERWSKFENFAQDMGERPEGLSLERINNDGDYEPNNCRWATPKEQASNTRRNRFFYLNGERLTLSEIARRIDMPRATLKNRLWRGLDIEQAVNLPVRRKA